jgi:hypothetical protein
VFSPKLELVLVESGGDKIPRKGGRGITKSDLLIINKIDIAEYVHGSLDIMARDSKMMRGERPFVFANPVVGAGIAWGGLSLPCVETGISLSVILAGILIATLALTFAGRALGTLMQKTDNRFGRALGAVVAKTGALLAVQGTQLEHRVKTKSCAGLPRSFFYCLKLWIFAKGQTSSTEMF